MKYLLLFLLLLILVSLIYKYILADDDPIAYMAAVQKQNNPFTVSKDSASILWDRAKEYLRKNASLIGGGTLQQNDSLLYLPYYNAHQKGSSIRIEKHVTSDSVLFRVRWWYSRAFQSTGSKQIALYMKQGKDKSDFE